MEQHIDVLLGKYAYGGDAMGRLEDGRAVFVPFGLPGERVRIRLTEEKRNFARGELVEILEASPRRIIPRCKHFGSCGGCHYQSLPYEEQLKAKREILRDYKTNLSLRAEGEAIPWRKWRLLRSLYSPAMTERKE